jgi:hypothetical protein
VASMNVVLIGEEAAGMRALQSLKQSAFGSLLSWHLRDRRTEG